MMTAVLFGVFLVLLMLNIPVAFALVSPCIVFIYLTNSAPMEMVMQRMFTGLDTFSIMAIPFFMIAGSLMQRGGISKRLVNLANALVGSLYGGLGMVTILASAFFSAISGSGSATTAAIGAIMIPGMISAKYNPAFSAALQASAGYMGTIIPPSISMVMIGVITGASIGEMFIGGILPGLMIAGLMMLWTWYVAKTHDYVGESRKSLKDLWVAFKEAIWALLMPGIILGGIYGGIFTPTEAANVAVVYSVFVAVYIYKELTWKEVVHVFKQSAVSSAIILTLVSMAGVFGLILTREAIPASIAEFLVSAVHSKFMFLLIMNIVLLIAGTFLDTIAGIMILAPILYPVALQYGVEPVHFGIIMTVNLAIGQITPPLGVNLFVASNLTKLSIEKIARPLVGFLAVSIVSLLIITYVPGIVLWLPKLLM